MYSKIDTDKPTLAIYGIQDREDHDYPFYVHDHNLCLMKSGQVSEFLQLERITRRKRDNRLPEFLADLVRGHHWVDQPVDLVIVDNVVGRAFINRQGNIRFEAPLCSELASGWERGHAWWFGREPNAWVLNHELAHLFSCVPFFGMFKDNSLLVHFDGGASQSNFSAWLFRNQQLTKLEAHWNYRYLTALFNANALVFSVIGTGRQQQNSVPGKMMGLAAYGTYRPELEKWLAVNDFFSTIWGKTAVFFQKVKQDWGLSINSFDQKNGFLQDCMATIHELFVRETLGIFSRLKMETKLDCLYYAGGCALNIVTNTRLLQSGLFNEIYIPPCPEDSGLSLGAATYAEWQKGHQLKLHSPWLNSWGLPLEKEHWSRSNVAEVARAVADGAILGVCMGNGEAGPRALGNRSLICRADRKDLAQKVSIVHKKREWYRPVAPVMLATNTRYFTGQKEVSPLSRYMLLDFAVLPSRRRELAGAVHVDGTARIQTLFGREDHPFLWDVLTLLDAEYNIRALINTSFNGRGMPIVHTEEDACAAARAMRLDGLVLHGRMVDV